MLYMIFYQKMLIFSIQKSIISGTQYDYKKHTPHHKRKPPDGGFQISIHKIAIFKITFLQLHLPSCLRVSGYLRPKRNMRTQPIYRPLLQQLVSLFLTGP